MGEHRRPAIPFSEAARGTCRWCGEEILYESGPHRGELNRRRRWHPHCLKLYEASDPREARRLVRKRDRGHCAACGLDTNALKRSLRGRGRTRALRERGFVPRRSLWELDHIVPLIDGGGHELSNLQTLCTPCHKEKTAEEARKRAKRPKQNRDPARPPLPPAPSRPTRAPDAAELEKVLERAELTNQRVASLLSAMVSPRNR